MDSPCLIGKGAGAALAARIIAKERFQALPFSILIPETTEILNVIIFAYKYIIPRKMGILCGVLINPLSVWSSLGGRHILSIQPPTSFTSLRCLDCRDRIWSIPRELCTVCSVFTLTEEYIESKVEFKPENCFLIQL